MLTTCNAADNAASICSAPVLLLGWQGTTLKQVPLRGNINAAIDWICVLLLQLLFLAGMTITIGVQATIQFFSRKKNRKVGVIHYHAAVGRWGLLTRSSNCHKPARAPAGL
jgi:hypothetical protein